VLADCASDKVLQAKIPSSIYTIAKIPRDLQRATKGLNILVNKQQAEDNPKGKTLKTKYLSTPLKDHENPRNFQNL